MVERPSLAANEIGLGPALTAERVRELYAGLPYSLIVSSLMAILLAALQWPLVGGGVAFGWLGLLGVVQLARVGLALHQRRRGAHAPFRALWHFRIGATASGIAWGIGGYLLFPLTDPAHQAFVAFALGGIGAGASISLACDRVSVIAFVVTALLPVALRYASLAESMGWAMTALVLLYLSYLGTNAVRTQRRMDEHTTLRLLSTLQQQRLDESEAKLRHLFELSPVGITLNRLDDGRFLEFNDALLLATGYQRNELMQRSYWDLTPSEFVAEERQALADLRRNGRYGPYEKFYLRKDGSRFPVLLHGVLVHDRRGRELIWSIVQDMTAARTAQEALRLSEARWRFAIEGNSDGLWEWDLVSGEITFSARWRALLGYGDEVLHGGRVLCGELIHPDDRAATEAALMGHLAGDSPQYEALHRLLCRDGSYRWVLTRGKVVERSEDGQPLRLIAITIDFTERKQLEEELDLFRRIVDSAAQGISCTDAEGRVLYINPAHQRLTGFTLEEMRGRPLAEFLPSANQAQFESDLATARSEGGWSGQFPMARRAGGEFVTLSHLGVVRGRDGEVRNLFDIFTDHTAELERQQALTRARDEALRANLAKSEFLSRMSHELRTPLNAILGFAQLLETDPDLGEASRDDAGEIHKAGQHLLGLINEVLDLAKVETGHIHLSLEPVVCADVVASCLDLLRPLAEPTQIRLEAEVASGAAVQADRTRLKQALLNLISNAIKYNRPGGEVRVVVTVAERVRLTVVDSGIGIAEQRLGELFESFNRLDAEGGPVEGTGIGLVITRKLVELMGGTIGVASEQGVGSQFWIELPLAESVQLLETAVGEEVPAPAEQPSRTLLYIEDNPANLKLVGQILKQRPALRLITAAQGRDGIELAQRHQPDLILLDIHLPDQDGYTLLAQLRQQPATAHTPTIAVTANAMVGEAQYASEQGFDGYISKPLDMGAFLALIDRTLQGVNHG